MRNNHYLPELVASAAPYYKSEGFTLGRPNSKGWAMCKGQPFCHRSKSGKSFSVNLRSGAYFCHGCGTKGGDIVAYVMQRDAIDFKAACKSLGAWRGRVSEDEQQEIEARSRKKEQIRLKAEALAAEEQHLCLKYRDCVHAMERIVREVRTRLQSFILPDSKEYETCGEVLTLALSELREALAAYSLLSFGMVATRVDFVKHPETRDQTIAAVLREGIVRGDCGHVMEVSL